LSDDPVVSECLVAIAAALFDQAERVVRGCRWQERIRVFQIDDRGVDVSGFAARQTALQVVVEEARRGA
jgi:hypothetical protein